jgi:uncharacterized protein YggU (UPF0235/DUF167 family)
MKKSNLQPEEIDKIREYISQNNFVVNVKVTPGSRSEEICVENGLLRMKVREIPENGKANATVISLLASVLGAPRDKIIIVRGTCSGNKVVKVEV